MKHGLRTELFWYDLLLCLQQALALKACIGQGGEVEEEPDEEEQARSDLCREAAHNLVMIYKATGAMELAREVLHRHLTI